MLTPFGKELRAFRLETGELLKDMADKLGVSSAYLSSIENGKRQPTDDLMKKIRTSYDMEPEAYQKISEACARTLKEIKVNFSKPEDEEVGLLFARQLSSLSEEQRIGIIKLLKK